MHRIQILIFFIFFLSIKIYLYSSNSEKKISPKSTSTINDIFSFHSPEKKTHDEKIWTGSISGWYEKKSGNTDTLLSNLQIVFEIDDNVSHFIASYLWFHGDSSGKENENKGEGTIKFDHYIIPRVELFIFSISEYNKMSLLKHRNNTGSGPKFVIISNKILIVDLSGAFLYQYEKYKTQSHTNDYRWSLRFRTKLSIKNNFKFNCTYFYIPKFNYYKSYRLHLLTNISLRITDNLFIKVGYINKYNRDALPETKKNDKIIYSQLSLNF